MKIFLELWTGIGPLIRSLPIAQALRNRGHHLHFLAHDQSAQYMLACGFTQATINPQEIAVKPTAVGNWRCTDALATLRGLADPNWLSSTQKIWLRYFSEYKPDLVITDFGVQSAIAARTLDIPLVCITQSCMHPGRKGERIYYWENEAPEDCSNSAATTINEYLLGHGSEPITTYDDLYLGDKTLIPGFPEFDWLEERHQRNTYFSGPILWRGEEKKIPEISLEFHNNNPRIFMYTGRLHDSAGNSGEILLNTALAAAAENDSINFIISTGGMDAHASDFENKIPRNVKIVDWLPIEQAYNLCDIIIHHGGHGSCMANFKYAKPALIIPTHTERNYNAHRMQDLQSGIIIRREDISPETLLEGINNLINNKKYAENIKYFQKLIQKQYPHSAEHAADYIES